MEESEPVTLTIIVPGLRGRQGCQTGSNDPELCAPPSDAVNLLGELLPLSKYNNNHSGLLLFTVKATDETVAGEIDYQPS
ncbi:MAG: hypothetical protein GF399_10050 [Candidatus Coatesbacteria bacterium]|nr:hypothetical protein [Candidatus Coatesbacteria bacterium]